MHHSREPELTGRIVVPESPQYDAARQVFNQYFNRFPSIIVYAGNTQDVVNAIRWARCRNVPVRIRSGGHNYEGLSALNNGMVIDMSNMKSIWSDPKRGIAIVQPGVENNEIYHALGEKGMVVPGGVCPTPAIAGVGLGGGHSMLVRAFGLTLDHLLEVEMVDASGRILYANAHRNADLFWALRGGGGGNFGICTAFCFRTCPIGTVCMADIGWSLDDMEPVLKAWQDLTLPGTDKRLTPILTISSGTAWTGEAPKTQGEQPSPVNMQAIYLGPLARLRELLQPLLASGTPQRVLIKELPWLEAVDRLSAPQPHSRFLSKVPIPLSMGCCLIRPLPSFAALLTRRLTARLPFFSTLWEEQLPRFIPGLPLIFTALPGLKSPYGLPGTIRNKLNKTFAGRRVCVPHCCLIREVSTSIPPILLSMTGPRPTMAAILET